MNSAIAKKNLQRRTAIYFENLQLLYIFKLIKGLEGIYNKLRLKWNVEANEKSEISWHINLLYIIIHFVSSIKR